MDNALVKSLLIEIDGTTEKLRRALREGGVELEGFADKAKKSGAEGARGADAMATRQARAARTIAATTETIARQGKVTGETAKQGIAAASNMAFAFGPHGAIVGAIGISTLAIVSMFVRVRKEAEETASKAREEFTKMVEDVSRLVDAGDVEGLMKRARDLYVGTPSQGFADAIPARQARIQRLRSLLPENAPDLGEAARRTLSGSGETWRAALKAEEEALAPLIARYERLSEAILAARTPTETRTAAPIRVVAEDPRSTTAAAEKMLADAFRTQAARIEQVLADWQRGEETYERRFTEVVAKGFIGSIEDIRLAFVELTNEATKRGQTDRIPVLDAAREKAVALATELGSARRLMESFDAEDLDARIARTDAVDLSRPLGAPTVSEAARQAAEQLAVDVRRKRALEQQRDALRAQGASSKEIATVQSEIDKIVARQEGNQGKLTRSLADQAREVVSMVDGVLQLASAWGSVSRETTDVLRAVVGMVGAVPGLVENLAKLKAARAAGEGVGVGVGAAQLAVAGSALPIIGALATLGATLMRSSPEEKERKRVQRENTRAIQQLTAKVGLLGIDLTGNQFRAAQTSVSTLLAQPDRAGRGIWRNNGKINWRAAEAAGIDRSALERAAEALGLTLDGTIGSFGRLWIALEEAEGKVGEFSDSYADKRTLGRARMEVRGVTDPVERVLGSAEAARQASPAIAALFEGLDLTNAEDREKLNQRLLELLDLMEAGGGFLTVEQMGGLTPEEVLEQILEINRGLDAIGGAAAGAGTSLGGISGFRGLTEAAGERMSDYLRALTDRARIAESQRERMTDALQQQLQYLAIIAQTPLTLPALPGQLPRTSNAGAGAVTLYVSSIDIGGISITVPAGADGAAIGTAAALALEAHLEPILYRILQRASKARGDVTVTSVVH